MPEEFFEKLWKSMPDKVAAVFEPRGGYTKYKLLLFLFLLFNLFIIIMRLLIILVIIHLLTWLPVHSFFHSVTGAPYREVNSKVATTPNSQSRR